jgi:hypothetical protein
VSEPDLTAELDAAEDIVMGRVDAVVTEWGVRYENHDLPYGTSHLSEQMARRDARTDQAVVIRRTVTYSPWEETE